jgi:NADH:ubiquinone oxidoreductase subunit 4 (subunit M)
VTVLAMWGALVIGAVYMLRAIRSILHGPVSERWNNIKDAGDPWRRLPFALLLASLLLFGVAPRLLTDKISPSAEYIVKLTAGPGLPATADATVGSASEIVSIK